MKNETDSLNEAIVALQRKRSRELELLKEQLHISYESLKPINLIKSTFKEISASSEIKDNILGNLIGLGTGFLSRKLLVGGSHNPIKRLFGTLIQFAITNVVSKHADGIKSAGEKIIQRFLKSRKESKPDFHHNGTDLFI